MFVIGFKEFILEKNKFEKPMLFDNLVSYKRFIIFNTALCDIHLTKQSLFDGHC